MADQSFFNLPYTGEFSLSDSVALAATAAFVSPMRKADDSTADKVLDLAFSVEGSWSSVGLGLRQDKGQICGTVIGNPDGVPIAAIMANVSRILSLDVDGAGFMDTAARDPVVAALQTQRPGIRPVLFPSPYECAARAIIGQRLFVRQASILHARIAALIGVALNFGDHIAHAFPAPERLARLQAVPGLADRKVDQLRALGAAARDGWLDTTRLRAMPHDEALSHLQKLPGIGPFSADLILIRGAGDPDAFPRTELGLQFAMTVAYDMSKDSDFAAFEAISERWRPYRSWVGLLLRNAEAYR